MTAKKTVQKTKRNRYSKTGFSTRQICRRSDTPVGIGNGYSVIMEVGLFDERYIPGLLQKLNRAEIVPLDKIMGEYEEKNHIVANALRGYNLTKIAELYHKNIRVLRRIRAENRYLRQIYSQIDHTEGLFENRNIPTAYADSDDDPVW